MKNEPILVHELFGPCEPFFHAFFGYFCAQAESHVLLTPENDLPPRVVLEDGVLRLYVYDYTVQTLSFLHYMQGIACTAKWSTDGLTDFNSVHTSDVSPRAAMAPLQRLQPYARRFDLCTFAPAPPAPPVTLYFAPDLEELLHTIAGKLEIVAPFLQFDDNLTLAPAPAPVPAPAFTCLVSLSDERLVSVLNNHLKTNLGSNYQLYNVETVAGHRTSSKVVRVDLPTEEIARKAQIPYGIFRNNDLSVFYPGETSDSDLHPSRPRPLWRPCPCPCPCPCLSSPSSSNSSYETFSVNLRPNEYCIFDVHTTGTTSAPILPNFVVVETTKPAPEVANKYISTMKPVFIRSYYAGVAAGLATCLPRAAPTATTAHTLSGAPPLFTPTTYSAGHFRQFNTTPRSLAPLPLLNPARALALARGGGALRERGAPPGRPELTRALEQGPAAVEGLLRDHVRVSGNTDPRGAVSLPLFAADVWSSHEVATGCQSPFISCSGEGVHPSAIYPHRCSRAKSTAAAETVLARGLTRSTHARAAPTPAQMVASAIPGRLRPDCTLFATYVLHTSLQEPHGISPTLLHRLPSAPSLASLAEMPDPVLCRYEWTEDGRVLESSELEPPRETVSAPCTHARSVRGGAAAAPAAALRTPPPPVLRHLARAAARHFRRSSAAQYLTYGVANNLLSSIFGYEYSTPRPQYPVPATRGIAVLIAGSRVPLPPEFDVLPSRISGAGLFARLKIARTPRTTFTPDLTHPARCHSETTPPLIYLSENTGQVVNERRDLLYSALGTTSFYLFQPVREAGSYLDATGEGGPARFLNHSCAPTLTAVDTFGGVCIKDGAGASKVFLAQGAAGAANIAFYANRRIAAGEELTFNYAFHDSLERCGCGSAICNGTLAGALPPNYIDQFGKI